MSRGIASISRAVLAIAAAASLHAEAGRIEPLALDSRLELFVDDYLIERMSGVRLDLHHPERAEKVLEFDRPWEGATCGYVNVFEDDGRYRMYYRGSGNASGSTDRHSESSPMTVCYAESRDGIRWTRPDLGIVDFRGSKKNNLVWMGQEALAFTPFRDANPAAPAAEKYKATGILPGPKGYVLIGFTSPDGLHWKKVGDRSIIPDESPNVYDAQTVMFWDAERRRYVAFYRAKHRGVRWVKHAESEDFASWPEGKIAWVDFGEAPMEHLYTNAAAQYARAPQLYVAFPNRYVPSRKAEGWEHYGVNDAVFMSSRDGVRWDRRFLEAFIRPGRDRRNWTDRNNYVAAGILQTAEDELSIYFTQNYRHPTAHLRRGVLRLDGFASAHAGYAEGELVTKPFRYRGDTLVLNYETSAAGSIRLEVQDEHGQPIPSFELASSPLLYGDEVAHAVTWPNASRWGSSLKQLEGTTIRLRFVMKDADLYSLRFRSARP